MESNRSAYEYEYEFENEDEDEDENEDEDAGTYQQPPNCARYAHLSPTCASFALAFSFAIAIANSVGYQYQYQYRTYSYCSGWPAFQLFTFFQADHIDPRPPGYRRRYVYLRHLPTTFLLILPITIGMTNQTFSSCLRNERQIACDYLECRYEYRVSSIVYRPLVPVFSNRKVEIPQNVSKTISHRPFSQRDDPFFFPFPSIRYLL